MNITLTEDIYWNSKDPKVQALRNTPFEQRETLASQLSADGFIIDRPIMLWGWSAVQVMAYRAQLGYTWCPNAYQPNLIDPLQTGVVPIGQTATDMTKPWPNSIKVSVDASDYPPAIPIVVPPLPNPVFAVGQRNGNLFQANISAVTSNGQFLLKDGQSYVQEGVTYIFHVINTPFGPSINFTLA